MLSSKTETAKSFFHFSWHTPFPDFYLNCLDIFLTLYDFPMFHMFQPRGYPEVRTLSTSNNHRWVQQSCILPRTLPTVVTVAAGQTHDWTLTEYASRSIYHKHSLYISLLRQQYMFISGWQTVTDSKFQHICSQLAMSHSNLCYGSEKQNLPWCYVRRIHRTYLGAM